MGKLGKLWKSVVHTAGKEHNCCAVIVAAGTGSRMGAGVNKQFLEIAGKPVLAYTLEAFDQATTICDVVVVAKAEEIVTVSELVRDFDIQKVRNIVAGGAVRQQSVYNGVMAAERCTHVAIHDGARPFILPETIDKAVEAAWKFGAAAVGVRINDTVKRCDDKGIITETVDRSSLWAVQTPQVFDRAVILGAHQYVQQHGLEVTDDCMALEAIGGQVRMVEGQYSNRKMTTPEDLIYGEAIVAQRQMEMEEGI